MSVTTLLRGGWIVTMDDAGTEHPNGWVLLKDGVIDAVGAGPTPTADAVYDLAGAVVTPGLVNVHHHLCQALTRARAQNAVLFDWLEHLFPIWKGLDADAEYAAAGAALVELAVSGCTTVFDHHYLFPSGSDGIIEAEIQAAGELGMRIVASRGSMDLSSSQGGLVPDDLAEDPDHVLAETERLARLHQREAGAMVQIAVAPCTPFTTSGRLIRDSVALARKHGLRLHTHLAETVQEELYCRERFGCRPLEYLAELGFLGDDAWCAHCVHLSDPDMVKIAAARTGVAHCPTSNLRLGCGIASVRKMLDHGITVGLGVDGAASNERGDLLLECKQAMLVARAGGDPTAMTCRDVLRAATRGGALILGRQDLGSIEPGKCADLAIWRTDGLRFGGADDLVAALVLSAPHRVDRLYVGGRLVIAAGALVHGSETEIARRLHTQAARFSQRN